MEEHAKKRLKWRRELRDCTQEYWNCVIFSDECAVQKDSDGGTVWVFRHQNKREKYDCKNIRGQAKGGGLFQMIWGCFAGAKLGPIVFINGTVNSDVYISILRDNLLLFIDAVIADGTTNIVFQQDNATYTSYIEKNSCFSTRSDRRAWVYTDGLAAEFTRHESNRAPLGTHQT